MLKERLPSFLLLILIAGALVFTPDPYGLALFIVVGCIAMCKASREMTAMLEKIGLPSFALTTMLLSEAMFLLSVFWFGDICMRIAHAALEHESLVWWNIVLYSLWGIMLILLIYPWFKILRAKNKAALVLPVAGTITALVLTLPVMLVAPLYTGVKFAEPALFGLKVACPTLLYLILITKIGGDTCAYIVGSLSNKITRGHNHQIAPNVSPKKSWEGALGAMIACVALSLWLGPYLMGAKGALYFVFWGVVLFWGGFFGDLAESALKRAAGVKDSGKMLPGTGGIWDVLDALVFNVPLFVMFSDISATAFSKLTALFN